MLTHESKIIDIDRIREAFPILQRQVHGKPLVYLDNAATTQKPLPVLDAIRDYYVSMNANIHRGVHRLSQEATDAYEGTREKARRFLNARDVREIVFVRGATEGINLVANSFGSGFIKAGDEVVISAMEHHSNIVPWQLVTESRGAHLRVIPMNDQGELDLNAFEQLLNERTRLVAVVHVSNALGTVNPVETMIRVAHARGIPVLLDGAQAASHMKIDVQALDCDFYVCSGHKMLGPTGIGLLYGKASWLEKMPPYQGGGDMIRTVSFEKSTWAELPYKFEAGTPNIAGGVALAAAIDYLEAVGLDAIQAYETELLNYALERLATVPGLRFIGEATWRAGAISFVLEDIHPHDIGTILDEEGIAIRTGHHCAQPVMVRFGVPATARASFALYNTKSEIDTLVEGLEKVRKVFA